MKKKIVKALVAGLIVLQLMGCAGQKSENAEDNQTISETTETTRKVTPIYFSEIKADEYVTLGDYKGLEVISTTSVVSDEEVEAYINYMLSMSGAQEEITERDVVEQGDIVNIDYTGKKDGVAFDGGTAQGYYLEIGSGTFIPGFEEGLIGVKKGETVDLNLTFPENYHSEELAGADVIFTVTVNGLYRNATPQFDDEFVASLGIEGVVTADDYRAYLKKTMEEREKSNALQDVQMQLFDIIIKNAEISEIPEKLIEKFYDINVNNMNYQAAMYGMDLESFVGAYYGMDAVTFENEATAAAEISAKQALVCLKIAADENIAVTDEDIASALKEKYAEYGYASAEDFEAAIDKEEYRDSLLLNKVVDFLVENATITEVPEISQ